MTYSYPKVTYSDPKVTIVTLHTSPYLYLPHLARDIYNKNMINFHSHRRRTETEI